MILIQFHNILRYNIWLLSYGSFQPWYQLCLSFTSFPILKFTMGNTVTNPWKKCVYQLLRVVGFFCFVLFAFIKTGVEDLSFAYGLLMELTRAYLAYADNSRAQDSAAYAIQVSLLIYNNHYWLYSIKC